MSDKKKKKRVGSVIFRIVLIIIAGLTVGIGVFSWNASGLVGNQLPMPFGFGVSVVMSPSMEPELHTNDLVFVTEQDSYDVGDIVVYQEGRILVIHRIVSIDGEKVITKGDANNIADDPILLSDVRAKLSFRIPFIGIIFKYLKTVPGTLLVLVLAIFLLYRSRQKEREKDREDLEDIVAEIKRLRSLQEASGAAETSEEGSDAAASEEAVKDSDSSGSSDEDTQTEDPAATDEAEVSANDTDTDEPDDSEPALDADTQVNDQSESTNDADTEKDGSAAASKEAETAEEESFGSVDQ